MASTTSTASTESAAFLSVEETARLLRVSESTVRRLARSGELPGVRVGRQWRIEIDGLPLQPAARQGDTR